MLATRRWGIRKVRDCNEREMKGEERREGRNELMEKKTMGGANVARPCIAGETASLMGDGGGS